MNEMARRFPQGGGQMKNMMKQMEKLQKEMAEQQKEIENSTFETSAGGGVVKVTINGKKEIVDLEIDPEVIDPEDVDTLKDLLMAAVNAAIKEAEGKMEKAMGSFTQGLNIPGLF